MLIKKKQLNKGARSLRKKLTSAFIIFAVSILSLLWGVQSVFLQDFYKQAMEKKLSSAVQQVSDYYSFSEDMTYDSFCEQISAAASQTDVFFYVESTDFSFAISSTDMARQGRFFSGTLISEARNKLVYNIGDSVSEFTYSTSLDGNNEAIVYAGLVQSEYRGNIYLYAVAPLTPLGPAISIIRNQLLWVTGIVLILAIVIAAIVSKRFSKPMILMSSEAEKLGEGNFDVNFPGADYYEINNLADTLNSAAVKLKASDDLNRDLLANVSHDLRTPLTMIKSYAEMIRDISGDNKERREEHLNVIIDETDRMANLVGDILDLSKMQAGVEELHDDDFDLMKCAESIFATYKIMETDGYTMKLELCEGEVMVHADEHRISQVISNFLSNAIRYSGDDKYVMLRVLKLKDDKVRLEVIDRGPGIANEDKTLIWNRYQKVSKTGERSKEGTGLGLSIAAEILKREKASFGIDDNTPHGSVFWFSISCK